MVFLGASLCFLSGPGQNFSFSGFLQEYAVEFNMSYSELSVIFGIATIVAGFGVIPAGSFIDRVGQRKATLYTGLFFSLVCFTSSFIHGKWGIFLSIVLLRFCAQDVFIMIARTLINQWFTVMRGRAHAFMGLGINYLL